MEGPATGAAGSSQASTETALEDKPSSPEKGAPTEEQVSTLKSKWQPEIAEAQEQQASLHEKLAPPASVEKEEASAEKETVLQLPQNEILSEKEAQKKSRSAVERKLSSSEKASLSKKKPPAKRSSGGVAKKRSREHELLSPEPTTMVDGGLERKSPRFKRKSARDAEVSLLNFIVIFVTQVRYECTAGTYQLSKSETSPKR